MFENIHEIAVLVSTLLAIAVGSIWYSPLVFGEYWMKAIGITEADLQTPKKQVMKLFVLGFFANIVLLFTLATFVSYAARIGESIWPLAGLLTILIGAVLGVSTVWEQRSLTYFCINAGYAAVVVYGGMTVIAYWPW